MKNKKLNILIISYYFAPINVIGSIRMTKIAKYLKRSGHNVTVLSTKNYKLYKKDKILEDDVKGIKTYRTCSIDALWLSCIIKQIFKSFKITGNNNFSIKNNLNQQKSKIRIIIGHIFYKIVKTPNITWFLSSYPVLNRLLKKNNFDIVLSTFGPIYCHYLGLYAKIKQKNIFWIADYRDVNLENFQNAPRFLNRIFQKHIEQKILKNANAIINSSKEETEIFKKKVINKKKAYMFPFGYDLEDLKYQKNIKKENKTFRIIYTGLIRYTIDKKGIIHTNFDLSLLFHALSNFKNGRNIKFIYVGKNIEIIKRLIKQYSLEDIFEYKGFIERKNSINEQLKSHISLLLTWGFKESRGVIPAKLAEYIMTKNKILCIIKGYKKYNEISNIIKKNKLGLVIDTEGNKKKNKKMLFDFLSVQYSKFLKGKLEKNKPLKEFDYKNITKQILKAYTNSKSI